MPESGPSPASQVFPGGAPRPPLRPQILGARRIFRRFLMVAVGLNAMVGLVVVSYDVADSIWATHQQLENTAQLLIKTTRRLREVSEDTDAEVVAEASRMTRAPMALLDGEGRVTFASHSPMPGKIGLVFDGPPPLGTRVKINDELDQLSGAWSVSPFSDRHRLVVIALRTPEQEGLVRYMTTAAALSGLGLTLSVIFMLAAANWMLRRPLDRLLEKVNSALQDQLAFRNSLMESSEVVGIVAADAEGVVQVFNRAAEQILGYPGHEVKGRVSLEVLRRRSQGWPRGEQSLAATSPPRQEEGEEYWLDCEGDEHLLVLSSSDIVDKGRKLGRLLTFIDITERRRLELELRQSELLLLQSAKMATLGEMATGVAHELNQPLNNIGLLASRLQLRIPAMDLPEQERRLVKQTLDTQVKQVGRASRIIDHLRSFGRPKRTAMGSVKLADPIQSVVDLFHEQCRKRGIQVDLDLPEDLPPVHTDEGQLEQVMMNLLVNARQALESLPAGSPPACISISAAQDHFPDGAPAVAVRVADNGPGIPPELQDRIFDPFFTTKDVGEGTGLGLSISYGLVRGFGGTLGVASGATGSTFTLMLKTAPSPEPGHDPKAPHGQQQV